VTDPVGSEHADAGRAAWRSRRAWVVLVVVAALGVTTDLVSKTIAFAGIGPQPAPSHAVDRAVFSLRFGEAWRAAREFREDVEATRGRSLASKIPHGSTITVAPYVLELSLVFNRGAVFGIGAGKRWAFILFTFGALGFAVWMFGWWTGPGDRAAHIAIGLLISGGLGNLYDRLVYACVRDFIHPLPGVVLPFGWRMPHGDREIWPYVSNLADLWLILGIGTLMVCLFRQGRKKSEHVSA
jgi:lipoprotein signal peptidase